MIFCRTVEIFRKIWFLTVNYLLEFCTISIKFWKFIDINKIINKVRNEIYSYQNGIVFDFSISEDCYNKAGWPLVRLYLSGRRTDETERWELLDLKDWNIFTSPGGDWTALVPIFGWARAVRIILWKHDIVIPPNYRYFCAK